MIPLATVQAGYDSTVEALIRDLTGDLVVLAVVIAAIFEVALLYVVLRYRNSGGTREPEYNPRLFTAYVLAVGVVLLFVGIASVQTLGALDEQADPTPEDAVGIDVVSQQFLWTFEYPDRNVSNAGTMVVPVNETVHLRLSSRDVIHSFHVPELGVKQDANPGVETQTTFTATSTGEYRLYCAEFCGQGHSQMLGTVRVVEGSAFDAWVEEQREDGNARRAEPRLRGPGTEQETDRRRPGG